MSPPPVEGHPFPPWPDLFATLPRADQRRWAEAYARGLVTVPGRKSVRRIAEALAPGADQSLQQFVNQSPWDWTPVRRELARHLDACLRPRAWVVSDVVFPKHGTSSVGVARQFAPSAGSVLNCQLGLAASLVGPVGAAPIDWRLMLPASWQRDTERRARTQVPGDVRHRARAQHVLGLLDELTGWQLAPRPVVVSAEHDPDVPELLSGLERRGLRYLVRVAPASVVGERGMSVAEVVARAVIRGGAARRSPRAAAPPPGVGHRYASVVPAGPGQRRILARWSPGRGDVEATWLTNLALPRPADLVELVDLGVRAGAELERMGDASGLRHFEGRSYRGWHHHATLASIAHAVQIFLPFGCPVPESA